LQKKNFIQEDYQMTEVEQKSNLVLLSQTDAIATITLNRSDKFNALSMDMLAQFKTALNDVAVRDDVSVVILEANGRGFCAGHDLKEMNSDRSENYAQELFTLCTEVMLKIVHLPQPVIAKIHATAVAAGCQLVASCDLAYASEKARFGVNGINLGLFCSTPSVPVSRTISEKRSMELLLTGRLIDATTAAEWGLINDAVPEGELNAKVDEIAQAIVNKFSGAIRLGKKMFYQQSKLDLENAYQLATERIVCNLMMDEAREGISNFLDKK